MPVYAVVRSATEGVWLTRLPVTGGDPEPILSWTPVRCSRIRCWPSISCTGQYEADDSGFAFGLARERQDDWEPPGWVIVAPPGMNVGEGSGPTLLRLSGGRLVQLPAPER